MYPINNIKEFLSTDAEWHSFLEGILEPLTWFWHKPMTIEEHQRIVSQEHHYYRLGKAISATGIILTLLTVLWFWRRRG